MNNTALIAIGTLLVLSGGYYVVSHKAPTENAPSQPAEEILPGSEEAGNNAASENPNPPTTDSVTTVETDMVEITVEGSSMKFAPNNLTVKKGQKIRLTFKNVEGFHDWKIDEFNAHTNKIKGGTEETIEFVADKAGSFEYYCSVGSHRAMGMVGTLMVTE